MTAFPIKENAMQLHPVQKLVVVWRARCDEHDWYGESNLTEFEGPAFFIALVDAAEHNRKDHPDEVSELRPRSGLRRRAHRPVGQRHRR